MAISLNNHETRIKTLEDKIGTGMSDTGWINGTLSSIANYKNQYNPQSQFLKYRILNGVAYLQMSCYVHSTSTNAHIGTLPNWTYGTCYFIWSGCGDRGGTAEGNSILVEPDGKVKSTITGIGEYQFMFTGTSCCPVNK